MNNNDAKVLIRVLKPGKHISIFTEIDTAEEMMNCDLHEIPTEETAEQNRAIRRYNLSETRRTICQLFFGEIGSVCLGDKIVWITKARFDAEFNVEEDAA